MRKVLFYLFIGLLVFFIGAAIYLNFSTNHTLLWRLHLQPSPKIGKSSKNYNTKDLIKFYEEDVIQFLAKKYKAEPNSRLQQEATLFLKERASTIDLSEDRLLEFLSYVSPETEKVYLVPVIDGEESLIIVQSGGKPDQKMKQCKIWVIRIRDGMLIKATATGNVTEI